MNQVHTKSQNAWRALCEVGGLEIEGRDAELAQRLHELIDLFAPDLDHALSRASTNQFVEALFQSIQPFAIMFREILDLFERAGAREGPAQWRVRLEDTILHLNHFEEFDRQWRQIDCTYDVPALDTARAFSLYDVVRKAEAEAGAQAESQGADPPPPYWGHDPRMPYGLADVDLWLSDSSAGRFGAWPDSLDPSLYPSGLADLIRIAQAVLSIIRASGLDRPALWTLVRERQEPKTPGDMFDLRAIAQNETDNWLHNHVGCLAEILSWPVARRDALGAKLSKIYAPLPRRSFSFSGELESLERILSLPVWRQRHALYGVWIASRIVQAAEKHDVEVEWKNGELKFDFSAAHIATISSARPPISLYAERRVPLANPIGRSRVSGCQPDFSLWTDEPDEQCRLVVEVKHYGKPGRKNFREALVDYANGHPSADVVLVNYGPVGPEFEDLPRSVRSRCQLLGPLTPLEPGALEAFRSIVANRIGPPHVMLKSDVTPDVVAVDVSLSMKTVLASPWLAPFLAQTETSSRQVAMIDTVVADVVEASEAAAWIEQSYRSNSTSLNAPLRALLGQFGVILVITDADGLDGLEPFQYLELPEQAGEPPGLRKVLLAH